MVVAGSREGGMIQEEGEGGKRRKREEKGEEGKEVWTMR